MKLVINKCYGGFGLSEEAVMAYAKRKGMTLYPEPSKYGSIVSPTYYRVPKDQRVPELAGNWLDHPLEARRAYNEATKDETLYGRDIARDDPDLVAVVEELGSAKASGRFA